MKSVWAALVGVGLSASVGIGIVTSAQTTLPDGEGRAIVQRMCGTGCHAIQAVTKHRMSPQRWEQVVDNMMVRGAVGTSTEIDLVVRYLARHFAGPDPEGTIGPASRASAGSPDVPPRAIAPTGATGPASAVEVAADTTRAAAAGWPVYGHDPGGQRFSPLTQLTPQNVAKLQRVWTLTSHPPELSPTATSAAAGSGGRSLPGDLSARAPRRGRMSQVTPLVIHDVMYLTTVANQALALEPETGRIIWQYDMKEDRGIPALRGLSYWPGDGLAPPTIFFGTSTGMLVALNARTGQPVREFAEDGVLNLREGVTDRFPKANYSLSSPPVIYKHLVITGSRVQEQPSLGPVRFSASVGRADGQAGLDVSHRPATRRVRPRYLGGRELEGPIRRQRVGPHDGRRRARSRVPAARLGHLRLLRRQIARAPTCSAARSLRWTR